MSSVITGIFGAKHGVGKSIGGKLAQAGLRISSKGSIFNEITSFVLPNVEFMKFMVAVPRTINNNAFLIVQGCNSVDA